MKIEEAGIRLITQQDDLADLVRELREVRRYALDTEFHRERTYWASPALVQIAWEHPGEGAVSIALVDPLALDIAPLGEVLAGPATMVAHAAEQDLEILERACGRGPSRLFDTQVAAGFSGHSSPSLSSLLHSFLGFDLPKGDRLTDWRVRPLTASQVDYAASDVDHLLALADALTGDLDSRDRLGWAQEECEALRARPHGPGDPRKAWWKLRDARTLRAANLAESPRRSPRGGNGPPRHLISRSASSLRTSPCSPSPTGRRRVRTPSLAGGVWKAASCAPALAEEVMQAVERGKHLPTSELVLPPADDVPKAIRASVALVMAWVAQVAREEHLDPALLADACGHERSSSRRPLQARPRVEVRHARDPHPRSRRGAGLPSVRRCRVTRPGGTLGPGSPP